MLGRSWRPGCVLPAAIVAAMVGPSTAFMASGRMLSSMSGARFSSLAAISRGPMFAHGRSSGAVRSLRGGAAGMQAGIFDGISAKDIDGKEVDIGATYGKVPAVLVVNLGLTDSNYKELVELTNSYSSDQFVVLGFPCNQFGAQEPGTEAEIKKFAQGKYGAKFPLFSKIDVNGANTHPLYAKLKKEGSKTLLSALGGADIKWNFGKFLVQNNAAVKRFEPTTSPKAIVGDIDSAINKGRLMK